jgi:hypothetical protein
VRSETHIHMYRKKSLAYRWVPQGFEAILMLFLNPSVAANDVTLLMGPELIVLLIPNADSCVGNTTPLVWVRSPELFCSCERKQATETDVWDGATRRKKICVCIHGASLPCNWKCHRYLEKYKQPCSWFEVAE